MFLEFNENPQNKKVGDCVIRAISSALGQDWNITYCELMFQGYLMSDIPTANYVWGAYLKRKGFERCIIPSDYPDDYSVKQFAEEHKQGVYILALNSHIVAVIDGEYIDTWDCGNKIPLYYWRQK